MKKLILLLAAVCLANAAPAAELGTYPTLSLAKVAGVDASNNVGLATVVTLPCVTGTTTQVNQALYFSTATQTTACASQVSIDDNSLSVGANGVITGPDYGTWSNAGIRLNNSLTVTSPNIPIVATNPTQPDVALFQCPAGPCRFTFGTKSVNNDQMDFLWNYAGDGSTANALCIQFFGNSTCKWSLDTAGNETISGKLTTTLTGDANHVSLVFSGCGTDCGFYTNGAGLGMSSANFPFGASVWDYGITTASKFTLSVPTVLSSGLTSTTMTATAAAPTVAAAQIGYGSTTAASSNCGALASAVACIVVNIAGTVHYVPYY